MGEKRICDTRCTGDSRVTGGCRGLTSHGVPLKQPAAVIGRQRIFEKMIRRKGTAVEQSGEKAQKPCATTDDYC